MNDEQIVRELAKVAKDLKAARQIVASWTDLSMNVSGKGDLAKAKKIVKRNLGKEAANRSLMLGVFIFLDYQHEQEAIDRTLQELKRAGLKNAHVAQSRMA